jgi:RNA polymerase sigma-70 factor, ECF subfamily
MNEAKTTFLKAYEEHSNAIFRFCFMKVSNRETAKDLMQDVFTKTWEYIAKGGEVNNMRAFLYHVASNLVIDEYRKRRTESLDSLEEKGFDVPFDDTSSWVDQLDGEHLMRLVEKLPIEYRDAVFMRYAEDMSICEIALATGEKETAIRVRIHRGMQKLKVLLEEIIIKQQNEKHI